MINIILVLILYDKIFLKVDISTLKLILKLNSKSSLNYTCLYKHVISKVINERAWIYYS